MLGIGPADDNTKLIQWYTWRLIFELFSGAYKMKLTSPADSGPHAEPELGSAQGSYWRLLLEHLQDNFEAH